jgi:hypothetical protein
VNSPRERSRALAVRDRDVAQTFERRARATAYTTRRDA